MLGAVHLSYFFRKAASEFRETLLDTNTSRVQGDVEQRVVESPTPLESQVRKLLREVTVTAEKALASARVAREAGKAAIQSELGRLSILQKEIPS